MSDVLEHAEKFVAAIAAGDLEAVRACYAPDARIWHNFDGINQTVDENLKTLSWMTRKLFKRRYEILRREVLPTGFIQQHILRGELPDGRPFEMPACIICQVSDEGLITRLEEYLDPAQAAVLSEPSAA
jgi:ketosteroid isomerase-like protein